MHAEEFKRWLSDYVGKFPSAGAWLNKLPERIKEEQKAIWRSTLEGIPLRDALRVSLMMARGDLPAVGTYDSEREATGRHVLTQWHIWKRAERDALGDAYEAPRVPPSPALVGSSITTPPAPKIFQRILEGLAAGKSSAEISDEIWGDRDGYEPRYTCWLCRDQGNVVVLHYDTMLAYRCGRGPESPILTMAIPCGCDHGNRFIWDNPGKPKPRGMWGKNAPRFHSARFLLMSNHPTRQEIADFCATFFAALESGELERLAASAPGNASRYDPAPKKAEQPALPYKD